MAARKELPIPSFFNPKNAAKWNYNPSLAQVFAEANSFRKAHRISGAASDKKRIALTIIDGQKDFCFPEGTLYVAGRSGTGAIDDNARLSSFIYRNAAIINAIRKTFDTHFAFQVFFNSFFQTQSGEPLSEHTMIELSADGRYLVNFNYGPNGKQILHEDVVPNPAICHLIGQSYSWLKDYVKHYCAELARTGKYTLYLWPYHCILGTDGHALAGVLAEATMFHAFLRGSQSYAEIKGGGILTENYSVYKPEVLLAHDGKTVVGQKNTRFIETSLRVDAHIIAGQAASHCVASSIEDVLSEILTQDPELAKKVYILRDCMSAVVVPNGPDFTDQAEAALKKFEDNGMHVVNSTDPIESWPGINL